MQNSAGVGVDDDLENDLQSRDKSPFDCCVEVEEAFRLDLALRGLPSKQRKVIRLRYYGGLSLGEVAKATGMSLSNVKSTLYRSMVLLKSEMLIDGAINTQNGKAISRRRRVYD